MGFIVKNTTFFSPLSLFCPDTCRCCGALGSVLCECCKNYILDEHINLCVHCKRPILGNSCKCCMPLVPTFMVGRRNSLVGQLVEEYKYNSVRALGKCLAELLDGVLPFFDGPVAVVPLPTISRHIRERGIDHTLVIAKRLARLRHWRVERILVRQHNSVQVGSNETARVRQAFSAYGIKDGTKIDPSVTYLLLDDVWTTGASMRAATRKLREAGALKISIAVLAVS